MSRRPVSKTVCRAPLNGTKIRKRRLKTASRDPGASGVIEGGINDPRPWGLPFAAGGREIPERVRGAVRMKPVMLDGYSSGRCDSSWLFSMQPQREAKNKRQLWLSCLLPCAHYPGEITRLCSRDSTADIWTPRRSVLHFLGEQQDIPLLPLASHCSSRGADSLPAPRCGEWTGQSAGCAA